MSEYLQFIGPLIGHNLKKTKEFRVLSAHNDSVLGYIKWYGPWRQYCFFPREDCVWSSGCLADLAAFIKGLMDERKRVGGR